MTTIINLIIAVVIYRHASGKQRFNKVLIVILLILSLGVGLIAAYIGYRHNPDKDNMRFRDVL